MQKTEISKDKPLVPGDIIEMHFKSVGMVWIKASQLALIDWRLEGRKDFKILSWSLPNKTTVVFKVEILKTNPMVVTAVVIAAAISASLFMCWICLDKVFQIGEGPAGTGLSIGMAAAALAVLAMMLKK